MSSPRPSWRPLLAGTIALFLIILAFLAGQVKAGGDPALGRGNAATEQAQQQQQQPDGAARLRRRPGSVRRRGDDGFIPGGTQPAPPVPDSSQPQALDRRPEHPPVMSGVDLLFPSMGGEARVRLESVLHDDAELQELADGIHSRIEAVEAVLSRFRPDSELSLLNRDPRPAVPASALLRRAVAAGLWAAERSDGLVDPTLLGELEHAGYVESFDPASRADVDEALAVAPPRRPAAPAAWRVANRMWFDGATRIARAPGVRFDPGGVAKGMAADLAAASLPDGVRYAISCGGDLAVGGERPWDVAVRSARGDDEVHRLRVRSGGVATSGIGARIWRREDGRYAHHVLDPATGRPAWTGLVAVTAVAGTALEAEVLAKAALLSGPLGARRLLRRRGGVLQHDDGRDRGRARAGGGAAAAAGGGVSTTDPFDYPFWLASRSAGVVAYLLLSASVLLGLAMATRLAPRACACSTSGWGCWRSARPPRTDCSCSATAGCGRASAAARPLHVGLPAVLDRARRSSPPTAWPAALTIARRRLGAPPAQAHRFIPFFWALAAIHVIGAGTDTVSWWLRIVLAATIAAGTVLIVQRGLAGMTRPAGRDPARTGGGSAGTEPAPTEPAPDRRPAPRPETGPAAPERTAPRPGAELGLFR